MSVTWTHSDVTFSSGIQEIIAKNKIISTQPLSVYTDSDFDDPIGAVARLSASVSHVVVSIFTRDTYLYEL